MGQRGPPLRSPNALGLLTDVGKQRTRRKSLRFKLRKCVVRSHPSLSPPWGGPVRPHPCPRASRSRSRSLTAGAPGNASPPRLAGHGSAPTGDRLPAAGGASAHERGNALPACAGIGADHCSSGRRQQRRDRRRARGKRPEGLVIDLARWRATASAMYSSLMGRSPATSRP